MWKGDLKETFKYVHVSTAVEEVVVAVLGGLMGDSDRTVRTLEERRKHERFPASTGTRLLMRIRWECRNVETHVML